MMVTMGYYRLLWVTIGYWGLPGGVVWRCFGRRCFGVSVTEFKCRNAEKRPGDHRQRDAGHEQRQMLKKLKRAWTRGHGENRVDAGCKN